MFKETDQFSKRSLGRQIFFILIFSALILPGKGLALQLYKSVSGELTSSTGNPIKFCDVAILVNEDPDPYIVTSDVSGYYHFDFVPIGARIEFGPIHSSYDVISDPNSWPVYPVENDVEKDFIITPGVVLFVDSGANDPNYSGTMAYAGNNHVATFGTFNQAIFYPDQHNLPHSGSVWFGLPFHKFSPQDQGQFSSYDCTNYAIGYALQIQTIKKNLDISASYSWDNPGGTGWAYFPATPDNRVANNPNVYVLADFNASGTWPANRIKLNGVSPSTDLNDDNGHVAEFSYPIPACGHHDLQISVQYGYGGSFHWEALTAQLASGSSDANLFDADTLINVQDLVEFGTTYYLGEGESGYLTCADYYPDGFIQLIDLQIFMAIYYANPNKNGGGDLLEGDVWLSGNDDNFRNCIFKTEEIWDVAIVRFKLPGLDPSEIYWSPSESFVDRSAMVSNGTGDDTIFSLFMLGSSESGNTELGRLTSESRGVLDRIDFISTAIGSREKSLFEPPPPSEIQTTLGDASPNPFNPKTTISFDLQGPTTVRLSIFDVAGRLIHTLINGDQIAPGQHSVDWNGRTGEGAPVAGGVYFYRLDAGNYIATKRMTLLK